MCMFTSTPTKLWVFFSMGRFCCHMCAPVWTSQQSELHENHFQRRSEKIQIISSIIRHFRRKHIPFTILKEDVLRFGWTPHLLFCANSGAPIEGTPKTELTVLGLQKTLPYFEAWTACFRLNSNDRQQKMDCSQITCSIDFFNSLPPVIRWTTSLGQTMGGKEGQVSWPSSLWRSTFW